MAQVKDTNNTDNSNNNNNAQTQGTQPQALAGSSQGAVTSPTSGRLSNFSSGQQNTPGSGRFTNIQNYINANQAGTQNIEGKANNQFNKDFNKQQQDLSEKNQNIQNAFNQGRQNINQGNEFKNQLSDIQSGLNTGYSDFGNRNVFDTAAQKAVDLSNNQNYATVASGKGFDNNAVSTQQQNAALAAQNLQNATNQNLNNLQTAQGRNTLFSSLINNTGGYNQGQKSFDQLFLQGALGGIQSNLSKQNTEAAKLAGLTNNQSKDLTDINNQYSNVVSGLNTLANSNFNKFYDTLYNQGNVDYVQNLRNQQYNNLVNNVKNGGTLTQDQANLLGITPSVNSGINTTNVASKIGTNVQQPTTIPSSINVGNILSDPNAINKYIQKGQDASKVQDIVTQDDFSRYKALNNLIYNNGIQNADTKLSGVSDIGSAIKTTGNLGQDIADRNRQFNTDIAGNKYTSSADTKYFNGTLNSSQGMNLINQMNNEQKTALQNYYDAIKNANPNVYNPTIYNAYSNLYDKAKNILDQVNVNAGNVSKDFVNVNDRYSDAGSAKYSARSQMLANLLGQLNQQGYGNTLNVSQEDSSSAIPTNLKGLV
jgi:hypothetical protein